MENGDEGATYVGIFIGKSDFKRVFSTLLVPEHDGK